MTNTGTLGFIGLGVMGEPICRNIMHASSGAMIAFDIRPEPLRRLQSEGARIVSSIGEVAGHADIIFLSLPGGAEVEETVLGDGGLLANGRSGQVVVDLSTCPVETARGVALAAAEQGIKFADAPVARTRQAAEDGTLSVMVGCDGETFQLIRPLLAAAATEITHCGDVGAGQVVKLMNNMVLFQTVVALAEAFTVAERAGVAPEVLGDAMSKGSADSFGLRNHGLKAMLKQNFPVGAFATDYAIKDISYALELAADCKVCIPAAELARSILKRTSEAGFGQEYFPVLMKLVAEKQS